MINMKNTLEVELENFAKQVVTTLNLVAKKHLKDHDSEFNDTKNKQIVPKSTKN